MAGGPKATTTASGICCANALLSAAVTPLATSSAEWRSCQGLSATKKKPMFDEYAPVSRLKPEMVL